MILFHVTTPKKAKLYRSTGAILHPVRGFDTLPAAMLWAMKTGRKVIYMVSANGLPVHKLPDHHNQYGSAWFIDNDVSVDRIRCACSASDSIEDSAP